MGVNQTLILSGGVRFRGYREIPLDRTRGYPLPWTVPGGTPLPWTVPGGTPLPLTGLGYPSLTGPGGTSRQNHGILDRTRGYPLPWTGQEAPFSPGQDQVLSPGPVRGTPPPPRGQKNKLKTLASRTLRVVIKETL